MREGEGEWTAVRRRPNRSVGRWQEVHRRSAGRADGREKKGWVIFFFRNFLEGCSVEDLRKKFGGVGRAEDLFIPGKKAKLGKRFGFVRFSDGGDEEEILEKLNKIWVGSYIIDH